MTRLLSLSSVVAVGLVLSACAAAAPDPTSRRSASPTAVGSPDSTGPPTLGRGQVHLEAGTYRLDLTALAGGAAYPPFVATIPEGWSSNDGWSLHGPTADGITPSVAVSFWNVDQVFGDPCRWAGTLTQPGPGVEDLVAALTEIPMRSPTTPTDVEVDGHHGKYLEWSVPDDIAFDEEGNFPDCHPAGDGHFDFRSWTGHGWASTRYHQGPGQIDRLWILDVDGKRLVIDGFSMPWATRAEMSEISQLVESIQFIGD